LQALHHHNNLRTKEALHCNELITFAYYTLNNNKTIQQ